MRHGMCIALLGMATVLSAGDIRDPMRPAGTTSGVARSGPAVLRLEGVITGSESVAIINGRVLRTGETVAGATLIEILASGVRYSRGGRVQTLLLPGGSKVATVHVASEARKP